MQGKKGTASRGHKKRERTRGLLIQAGVAVMAEKGEALTVSEVVAKAQVSSGTFYNYFADRKQLINALSDYAIAPLAVRTEAESKAQDPAEKVALITSTALERAVNDPEWAQLVLRLTDGENSFSRLANSRLRADLASGFEEGRFKFGADEVTVDMILGFMRASILRIASGGYSVGSAERVIERVLIILGVPSDEAATLASNSTSS